MIIDRRAMLFQSHLQTALTTFADGLRRKIFFLLQREMNDPSLGRIQNSERKWNAVLANMTGGKFRHRVELGFARLTKAVGIDDEAMLSIKVASHRLKQNYFERVQQLTVLGKREMRVVAAEIQQAALIRPLGRDLQIETHLGDDLR